MEKINTFFLEGFCIETQERFCLFKDHLFQTFKKSICNLNDLLYILKLLRHFSLLDDIVNVWIYLNVQFISLYFTSTSYILHHIFLVSYHWLFNSWKTPGVQEILNEWLTFVESELLDCGHGCIFFWKILIFPKPISCVVFKILKLPENFNQK